jgi:hypothetical protein
MCNIILSKNDVHALIENTLLLNYTNHHLSFRRVVIFLLMESVSSMLIAAN